MDKYTQNKKTIHCTSKTYAFRAQSKTNKKLF